MADLPTRRCRGKGCGAPMLLAPTVNGKTMPLDAAPNRDGNVVIDRDLFGEPVVTVLSGQHLQMARETGRALWMPHHATCCAVEEFRHA